MTSRPCPICGSRDVAPLPFASRQADRVFTILHCGECEHRYLADPPEGAELASLYDRYYATDTRQQTVPRPGWRDRVLVRRLRPRLPPDARVLEVGCNFGETLLAFPRAYRLEGIDLSASAARTAAANTRLTVRQGFFEDQDYPPGSFDALLALAVIEHVQDPVAFLRKAAHVVRPGGMLVLMTGDYGAWWARRNGERWSLYHSVGHLHFFHQGSLHRAVAAAGFGPVDWLWAGPTPLTRRLPRPLGAMLHSQAASMLLPGLQARRRYGANMYCWAVREGGAAPEASVPQVA